MPRPTTSEELHFGKDFAERCCTPGYVHSEEESAYVENAPPRQNVGGDKDPSHEPVREVEEKLRNMMDRPLLVRKQTFKDLLVQNHPDKNSSEHAKEVFQTVNNARDWFLLEPQGDVEAQAE